MPGRGAGHARPRLRRPEGDCVPVSVRCQRRAGARLGGGGEGSGLCNGDCWRGAVSAPSRLPAAVAPPRRSASSGLKATGERAPLRGSEGAQCPAPVFSLRRLGLAAPVCARAARCAAVRPV